MKTVLIACLTHDASYYIEALKKQNVNPVVSREIEDAAEFDGLLLPGGGDISPIFYHRKNRGSHNICISEDIIQILLFHRFLELEKPILGICKGMQLINVALGGTLIQVLPTQNLHAYHNKDRYHPTTALQGSILHRLYGSAFITNSAHHQAVSSLGQNLKVTQTALDGTIEGIEHNSLPILGVQWHPERLSQIPNSDDDISPMPSFQPCTNQTPLMDSCVKGFPIFQWFSKQL